MEVYTISDALSLIGMSASQIGSFMAVNSLLGMVAPIFWGTMSDKYRTTKKVLLICTLGMLVCFPGIPLYARIKVGSATLAPIMLMTSIIFQSPTNALLTSWIMQKSSVLPQVQYGKIRLWWSFAYALACFTYMLLMDATSINIIFIGYGTFGLISLIVIKQQEDIDHITKRLSFKEMQFGRLFKSPLLLFFVIYLVLINVTNPGLGTFLPYLIEDVGGKSSILGGMVGIRSLCAIPLMFISGKLIKKFGARNLLLVSGLLYGGSQFLFFTCSSGVQAVGICVFMGISFGLLIPCQVAYISELAPHGLISTTQTGVAVMTMLSSSLANYLGGIIVQGIGIRAFYLFSMFSCFLGVAFFVYTTGLYAKRQKREDQYD
jgi:MFS family permease